jgi:ribosomal RNA assembly protein
VTNILEFILVPKDRIKVVKDRKTENAIEKTLKVRLFFQENSVEIEGEGIELMQAKNVVKAIARGFSPEKAFRLFDEDEMLEIIQITSSNDRKIKVIRSRLIGTKGKTRRMIESCSGCSVSVYGKTVSLIGKYEQVSIAREAVEMVLRGSKLSKVFGMLQRSKL